MVNISEELLFACVCMYVCPIFGFIESSFFVACKKQERGREGRQSKIKDLL